ncbi:glycosyltransferase family 2 protein [Alphaproteobacteria bacterium]|nr:glycosyltransferase family 2 protein [Alphaproteobacteria bacterium]
MKSSAENSNAHSDVPVISFLVPAFNEEKNIAATINEISEIASEIRNYEIVVVDDGSSDNTSTIAEELAKQSPNIYLLEHRTNMGFGAAYRTAYTNARGTYCMLIPGDNAHPAHTVMPIIQAAGKADMIIPYVTNPGARNVGRQILSKLFVFLVNTLAGLQVPYYNGLVLHKTHLLQSIDTRTSGYAYQAEIIVKLIRRGASFHTVPTEISERSIGETKAFALKNIIQVIRTLFYLGIRS